MVNLNAVVLSNNSIKSLEPSTFQRLTKLKTLDVSRNRLRIAPTGTFEPLRSLVYLNLSRNLIERLDNAFFSALIHLEVLDLSGNSIRFLAFDTFQALARLSSLNVSNNRIPVLQADMFSGLHSLATLSINGNSINSIEARTFRHVVNLGVLSLSHNSISRIDPLAFDGLHRLTHLDLNHNKLSHLPPRFTLATLALTHLNLAANPIAMLNQSQFAPGKALVEVDLSDMPHLSAVLHFAFADLSSLERVDLSRCPLLKYVDQNAFHGCGSLRELAFVGSGLETLHGGVIRGLPKLQHLSLQSNRWRCDCSLQWLTKISEERPELVTPATNVKCAEPSHLAGRTVFDTNVYHENCSNAFVTLYSPDINFRIGLGALLECQVAGDPTPAITWFTPRNQILHWYPEVDDETLVLRMAHSSFHDTEGIPAKPPQRLQVLGNGNLFISPVETVDAGIYVCLAHNSLGNHSVSVVLTLDYEILMHVKIVSILVGLATSVAFLLTMLVAQLVHMILNRWGWCCCRGKLPPKAKKIRKMLESVEHYKTQQLDRLRENYNMQVQRIKDNGTQQMERLRDSYSQQTETLRNIRDYGTLQIDRMRDQYYEQVRRVRDYSVQQMSRVRENYVFQRNRIRKFSAHQLFKLRENYKIQQMHLNKILENLNLESCRTVCARTDSVMFTSEITMDPCFVSGIRISPIPLDGTPNSADSADFRMPDLEEFEMQPFPLSLGCGDHESDGSAASLSIPVFPLDVDLVPLPKTTNQREDSRFSEYSLDKVGAGLEEIVTCFVDPTSSSSKTTSHKEVHVVNV